MFFGLVGCYSKIWLHCCWCQHLFYDFREFCSFQSQTYNFSQNLSQGSTSFQSAPYDEFSNLSQVRPISEFRDLVKVGFVKMQLSFNIWSEIIVGLSLLYQFLGCLLVSFVVLMLYLMFLIKESAETWFWCYISWFWCQGKWSGFDVISHSGKVQWFRCYISLSVKGKLLWNS